MTLGKHLLNNYKTILWIFLLVWLGVYLYIAANDGITPFEAVFYSAVFGLISAAICTVNIILFYYLFPVWSTTDHPFWDAKSNAASILNIVTISLANYACILYLNKSKGSFEQYLMVLGLTILIGAIVVIVVYFYESNQKLRKSLSKAKPIHEHLGANSTDTKAIDWTIQLGDEIQKINIESLLFIESNRNYVKLHFDGNFNTELRITLKEIEQKLADFDFLKRCHRSFIVNLNKVEKVSGNSTGYTLQLITQDAPIQVSRSYVSSVKKWLESNKKAVLIPS